MEEQATALRELAEQVAACAKCDLCRERTNAVPGEGNPNSDIVFIGEGPGFHEDQQGRPFVGQAGKFLDDLLASIRLRRQDVYICNVIKCRAPNNRDPLPGEIGACKPWLDQQLEIIRPRVIVTLGRYSMNRYLPGQSIGRIHGQQRQIDGITVVPMYHPAAALHQSSLRRTIEHDFQQLPTVLQRTLQLEAKPQEPEPVQMQLL